MKKCKDFCEKVSDYLDGEIGKRECELIERHLDECPPCALLYKSFSTTLEVCCKGVSDEIPPDVQDRLKSFLRQHCANLRSQEQ